MLIDLTISRLPATYGGIGTSPTESKVIRGVKAPGARCVAGLAYFLCGAAGIRSVPRAELQTHG